jgi:DNA-binding transcriptional ArsR family regulator
MNAPGGEQAVDRAAAAVLDIAPVQAVPTLGTSRPEVIDGWAEIFQAMADSNRLRILLAVHYAPGINVTELADAVGMTANATSHALAALRVRGIVRSERAGRERRWSIASEQIHALLHEVGAAHPPPRAD